jgi:hypothetical protein
MISSRVSGGFRDVSSSRREKRIALGTPIKNILALTLSASA